MAGRPWETEAGRAVGTGLVPTLFPGGKRKKGKRQMAKVKTRTPEVVPKFKSAEAVVTYFVKFQFSYFELGTASFEIESAIASKMNRGRRPPLLRWCEESGLKRRGLSADRVV